MGEAQLESAVVAHLDRTPAVAPRRNHHLSQFIAPDAARRAVYGGLPTLVPRHLYGKQVLRLQVGRDLRSKMSWIKQKASVQEQVPTEQQQIQNRFTNIGE